MPNQWGVRFTRGGVPVPVASESNAESLWFKDDASDLLGRAWSFSMGGAAAMYDEALHRYCQMAGWEDGFQFAVQADDGGLVIKSLCDSDLPLGHFWMRMSVFGFDLDHEQHPFAITGDNAPVVVEVPLPVETRQVIPTKEPEEYEDRIHRLVFDENSRIDGMPAAEWLSSRSGPHDPQRHACVLNLLAKLRGVPTPDDPLIDHIGHIIAVQLERVYVAARPTIAGPEGMPHLDAYNQEGPPVDRDCHQQMLNWVAARVAGEQAAGGYDLQSYRQAVEETSMQAVVGFPSSAALYDGHTYADLDIDLGNPLASLRGLLIHAKEIESGTITDHIALHASLAADANLAPYLYYGVTGAPREMAAPATREIIGTAPPAGTPRPRARGVRKVPVGAPKV